MRFGQKGRTPTIAKGAFGPSYTRQDNPDQDANEDAQNSVEKGGWCQKKKLAKCTRVSDKDNKSDCLCVAYGLPHPLAKCFYVFPENAL